MIWSYDRRNDVPLAGTMITDFTSNYLLLYYLQRSMLTTCTTATIVALQQETQLSLTGRAQRMKETETIQYNTK